MTAEMGKPVAEARTEVEKSATACDYYAENGPAALAPQSVDTGNQRSWVAYEPLGVVLAVMPWNFPYWQVLRFAAPTLMAGNTAILKHSPNVTGCALAIEKLFRAAGLPTDVFRSIVVAEADVNGHRFKPCHAHHKVLTSANTSASSPRSAASRKRARNCSDTDGAEDATWVSSSRDRFRCGPA